MGSLCSRTLPLKDEDLLKMTSKYFLIKKEILKLYLLWQKMGGDYYCEPFGVLSTCIIKHVPHLKLNPWSERICFTFASERDALSGLCSFNFDDFLCMASVFHPRTPKEIKYLWAFRMYDFDNDDMLGVGDVHQCVRIIVGLSMSDMEIKEIVMRVFAETDLDGDMILTVGEFAAVMRKIHTGFEKKFCIKILP